MSKHYEVYLTKQARKQFKKLPTHIRQALRTWASLINAHGIESMRKIPGYHDEPLKGQRFDQRSSRLSKGYRVIYQEEPSVEIITVTVLEVHKHDY